MEYARACGTSSSATTTCPPKLVMSTPLTESRLEATSVYPSTHHTFEHTWGVLDGSPESFWLRVLLPGAWDERFDVLRGAREQASGGTRHGIDHLPFPSKSCKFTPVPPVGTLRLCLTLGLNLSNYLGIGDTSDPAA